MEYAHAIIYIISVQIFVISGFVAGCALKTFFGDFLDGYNDGSWPF